MTITLDLIDWFTGEDAVKACAADRVTTTDDDWCVAYYYRNNDKTTVTTPMTAGVTIRLAWDHSGNACSDPTSDEACKFTVAQFPVQVGQHAPTLADVGVNGGKVISITGIFTPCGSPTQLRSRCQRWPWAGPRGDT